MSTAPSTNLSGKPSQLGGKVARAFGWLALAIGTTVALAVTGLIQLIAPDGAAGFWIGGGFQVITIAVASFALMGGNSLVKHGQSKEKLTRTNAIFALASHQKGIVRAQDVSRALSVSYEEADKLLTELAKTRHDEVRLELEEGGSLYYRFPQVEAAALPRVRVGTDAVDAEIETSPTPGARQATRE